LYWGKRHFVFFSAKPDPNDVDLVLIFADDFDLSIYDEKTKNLFDHQKAEFEFGASVFWIRPSMRILETMDRFIEHWQIKRDNTRRGIVEVRP
jgi:hypothetical protein